jgi:hypothetical protein
MNIFQKINVKYYFLLLLYAFIILLARITLGSPASETNHPRIINKEISFRIRKRRNESVVADPVNENITAQSSAIDPGEKSQLIHSHSIFNFFTGQISFAEKTFQHLADNFFIRISGPPIYLRLHSLTI